MAIISNCVENLRFGTVPLWNSLGIDVETQDFSSSDQIFALREEKTEIVSGG